MTAIDVILEARPRDIGRLAVLPPGAPEALADSRVLVFGRPSLGPRLIDWFVTPTQDRIDRARAAWRDRTFPTIPGDERVPRPAWPATRTPSR